MTGKPTAPSPSAEDVAAVDEYLRQFGGRLDYSKPGLLAFRAQARAEGRSEGFDLAAKVAAQVREEARAEGERAGRQRQECGLTLAAPLAGAVAVCDRRRGHEGRCVGTIERGDHLAGERETKR